MEYKTFPLIQESLSTVGFGSWGISGGEYWQDANDQDSLNAIAKAIELGVNFFDVAPVYGFGHAESLLGQAFQGKRDQVFIATKCGLTWDDQRHVVNNLTRQSIFTEIDQSLARLKTDYVDLYQLHWPDPNTDLEETMTALAELKETGKIRHIGLTNFSLADLKRAHSITPVSSYQGLYNLLEHDPSYYHAIPLDYRSQSEILPYVVEQGMMFLPYSPLMQGLLTDHFTMDGVNARDVRHENPKLQGENLVLFTNIAEQLRAVARELNKPMSQVAINWLIAQTGVGPIICGGLEPEHVTLNAQASDWQLSENHIEKINAILKPFKDQQVV